jgi:hypothetical protein
VDSGALLKSTLVQAKNPPEVHFIQRMELSVRRMSPIASLFPHVEARLGISVLASFEYEVVDHCGEEVDTKVPRTPIVPVASMTREGQGGQLGVPQLPAVPGVGHAAHAPDPLHSPFVHSLSGSSPVAMTPHVPELPCPIFVAEQAMQLLVQALLQQTPSTQKPEVHCVASVQDVPLGCGWG